jgi:hypothetical protein
MDSRFGDCPECNSAGSVEQAVCQVCLAELDDVAGPDVNRPGSREEGLTNRKAVVLS